MYCSWRDHLCNAGKAAEAPPVLCKSCRRVYKTPLCLRPQPTGRYFRLCKSGTCCQTCRAATGSPEAICSLATLKTASPCSLDSHSIWLLVQVANFLCFEAQEAPESCEAGLTTPLFQQSDQAFKPLPRAQLRPQSMDLSEDHAFQLSSIRQSGHASRPLVPPKMQTLCIPNTLAFDQEFDRGRLPGGLHAPRLSVLLRYDFRPWSDQARLPDRLQKLLVCPVLACSGGSYISHDLSAAYHRAWSHRLQRS